ncbi:Transcription factor GRAS [Corchorus olitorius]|uniref:Transcription factor GRAS n=1 Tax=Corchorus olitorius TaxID=93759 RepID=A0A1R3KYB5_9ROSI|nr:Transcription factor GRAS [Corchorus olitorius]
MGLDLTLSAMALYYPFMPMMGDNDCGWSFVQPESKRLRRTIKAVACRDKSHASALLSDLRNNALVFGSSFQRVASCFVQGLADRLALVQLPLGTVGLVAPVMNIMDIATSHSHKKEEALRLVYEICPHIQFGHLVANSSILEAFEGESFVHVVDLGMTLGLPHGHQWRHLIQSLANRARKPPSRLRITAVGLCVDRFRTIGQELEAYAKELELGMKVELGIVESNLENLRPQDNKVLDGEVVVVNSILQLHCVVKESRGALNSVLHMIHQLSPKALVLVEQDSSGHNGPFFLGRFMEALHYYSAIFDSLDAMLPKYDTRRAKMEQFYFAEEINNIVSCEGPARVERHERVDQWRRRMSRAGFQAAPLRMLAQAKQWLVKNNVCQGYTVVEDKGCLVLGWKSKPIVAASCWKC